MSGALEGNKINVTQSDDEMVRRGYLGCLRNLRSGN